jgi:hypothetical protein
MNLMSQQKNSRTLRSSNKYEDGIAQSSVSPRGEVLHYEQQNNTLTPGSIDSTELLHVGQVVGRLPPLDLPSGDILGLSRGTGTVPGPVEREKRSQPVCYDTFDTSQDYVSMLNLYSQRVQRSFVYKFNMKSEGPSRMYQAEIYCSNQLIDTGSWKTSKAVAKQNVAARAARRLGLGASITTKPSRSVPEQTKPEKEELNKPRTRRGNTLRRRLSVFPGLDMEGFVYTSPTGGTYHQVLYTNTSTGVEMWDLGQVVLNGWSLQGLVNGSIMTAGLQYVESGFSPISMPPPNTVPSLDWIAFTTQAVKPELSGTGIPDYDEWDYTQWIGPIDLAPGDSIWLSAQTEIVSFGCVAASTSQAVAVDVRTFYSSQPVTITGATATLNTAVVNTVDSNIVNTPLEVSPVTIGDVNIVGIDQLDNAVWVSPVNQDAPVMNVPTLQREGVFNPYGNGQPMETREIVSKIESVDFPIITSEWLLSKVDQKHIFKSFNNLGYKREREVRPPRTGHSMTQTERKLISGTAAQVEKDKDGEVVKARHVQFLQVVRRISSRLRTWSNFIEWCCAGDRPSNDLMIAVFVGCRSKIDEGLDMYLAARHEVYRYDFVDTLDAMAVENVRMQKFLSPEVRRWLRDRFPRVTRRDNKTCVVTHDPTDIGEADIVSYKKQCANKSKPDEGCFNPYGNGQPIVVTSCGYDEIQAAMHNKLMHMINGNMEFPRNMIDIEKLPNLTKVLLGDGDSTGEPFEPLAQIAAFTGVLTATSNLQVSASGQSVWRASYVNEQNVTVNQSTVPVSEQWCFPMAYHDYNGNPRVQAHPPSIAYIQTERLTSPDAEILPYTVLGGKILELVRQDGRIRADQMSTNNFKTEDLSQIIRAEDLRSGDTITSWLVKLWLYQYSRSLFGPINDIPMVGQVGRFVPTFVWDGEDIQVVFNDDNNDVVGSGCGGRLAPFWPYLDPNTPAPQIAFHVTVETIPSGSSFWAIPAGLINTIDIYQGSLSVAMMALVLAPYPCGLHSMTVGVNDVDGENPDLELYVPFSDCVAIDGETFIHILLPWKSGRFNADSSPAVQSKSMVIPKVGPVTAGSLVADSDLNINWIGGQFVSYSLVDYLVSWMADPNVIEPTTIARFKSLLLNITGMGIEDEYALHVATNFAMRYPRMGVQTNGTVPQYGVTDAVFDTCSTDGTLYENIPQWPTAPRLVDYRLGSTNYLWWCKTAMRLVRTKEFYHSPKNVEIWNGNRRVIQYGMSLARVYAVTSQMKYNIIAQPANVWFAAFSDLNFVAIRSLIQGMYVNPHSRDLVNTAEYGDTLEVLMATLTNVSPARDRYGNSIWMYRRLPQSGFMVPMTTTAVLADVLIPTFIADVWVQITARKNYLEFTALLSALKKLRGIYSENRKPFPLGNNRVSVPIEMNFGALLAYDEIAYCDPIQLFNSRLIWHTFNGARVFNLTGAVEPNWPIGASGIVTMRPIPPQPFCTDPPNPFFLTAATQWFPMNNLAGERLVVGTIAGQTNLMTQVLAGVVFTQLPAWVVAGTLSMPNKLVQGGKSGVMLRRRRQQLVSPMFQPQGPDLSKDFGHSAGQESIPSPVVRNMTREEEGS